MPVERIDAAAGQGLGLSVDELVGDAIAGGALDPIKRRSGGDYVLVFRTKKDGRVRPEHAALEGRIWELDDPDAPIPPLAPNCRCEVRIEPRETAAEDQTKTPAGALRQFEDLTDNLATVYPQDVVDAYEAGTLRPEDVIIKRTGDRITTAQARAVIASRKAGASTTAALKAVAELADKGLSGKTLSLIVDDARLRIARGAAPREAARSALQATQRRGYVTPQSADAAASSLARSRLLDGVEPTAAAKVKGTKPPPPTQRDQIEREGMPLRKPSAPLPWAENGKPKKAPSAPEHVAAAERLIARRTTERLLVWDADGALVASAEGGVDFVNVPKGIPRGCTFTHCHPSGQRYADDSPRSWGTALSTADLRVARSTDAEVMRSVTPAGLVSEIRRPPGGWPSDEAMASAIASAEDATQADLLARIMSRSIAPEQAGALHGHHVNQRVAAAIGARYRWGVHD